MLRFYIYNDQKEQHELGPDEIHDFVRERKDEDRLFVFEPKINSEVIIKFDVRTGDVSAVSNQAGVEINYSFEYLTQPVIDAIRVLAKRNLLLALYDLNVEPVKKIIDQQHHTAAGMFNPVNEAKIDETFAKLQRSFKPALLSRIFPKPKLTHAEKAIAKVLLKTKVQDIKSGKDVARIMKSINNHLAHHHPKPHHQKKSL